MKLVKTMKDVDEAEVHKSEGRVQSSLEYLPEGWCKLSLCIVSLFEFRWISVTSNRKSILDPSLGDTGSFRRSEVHLRSDVSKQNGGTSDFFFSDRRSI